MDLVDGAPSANIKLSRFQRELFKQLVKCGGLGREIGLHQHELRR